jgi:hypothetical protein
MLKECIHSSVLEANNISLIFDMIDYLLDLTIFTMEYERRSCGNPFNDKWLNSSRTRTRINKLKLFLYDHVKQFLKSKSGEPFFESVLRREVKIPFAELCQKMDINGQDNPLYFIIFYKIDLDELFMFLSQLIAWEHSNYPHLFEELITKEIKNNPQLAQNEDILRYYIHFLDVLTGSEIISLFDLEALRYSVSIDKDKFGKNCIEELKLFTDWKVQNPTPIHKRFPDYKTRITEQISKTVTP